ncbi:MAG: glycoside hydrolase family 78 protein [Dysgonamonadaceae bacterium]|jgi:alpha-L-rhamnosidase|nr:glycoside hydrolase family 78 protein [Dysgonamonadaceae bacterium]
MRKNIIIVLSGLFVALTVHAQSPFDNAQWIGGSDEDLPLYSQYLSVFKIQYDLQLDKPSKRTKAGFIFGANDMRLMDACKNMYHIENHKDSSYILVELENIDDKAQLHIYRVGYSPNDKKDIPLQTFEIAQTIINQKNIYEKHTFYIEVVLGKAKIYIDGTNKENMVADVTLNPLGSTDRIAFPVLADIGFSAEISNVAIRNFRSPGNVIGNIAFPANDNSRQHVLFNPSQNSMPLLRTQFNVETRQVETRHATSLLYITARGIYVPYLNGKRIGNDYFNPGHTQYNKTLLYQIYDVTDWLKEGKNDLQVQLGEGWWSGNATYDGQLWNYYGDRNSLLAKLVINYANGKEDTIVTHPETWEYTNESPVIYGSLLQGEVYDARVRSQQWKPAIETRLIASLHDYSDFKLVEQFGQTVQAFDTLTAISVEEVRPHVFVYDMGQNMVGVPKIQLPHTKAGQKMVLRFAEVKYPNLPEYKNNRGELMFENIRGAMAQDIYICSGAGNEIFQPHFTFHGYRFVEITGIDRPLPTENVQGIVLSSIDKFTAHYETSNPKVNRLWENIKWSMLGNFLSIPTDCPQRNERMGWSGDISVFSRTATYLADVRQFLRRHLLAMRDVQREDGRFTDVAPMGGGFGGLLWGSAGITVAWETYRQYGDTTLLAEHYDAMKRYIDFVPGKYIDKETHILVQENPDSWSNLGDWLGLEQEKNDNSLLWESYFLFDLEIMKNVAAVLGKTADEQFFNTVYNQRKAFFNETYIDKETGKTICSGFAQNKQNMPKGKLIDTQTSYVLPLVFNIVNEEMKPKFVENLKASIERENKMDDGKIAPPYSLLTGFIGTAWINKALSDAGRSDLAYILLQQTSYPSWLYPVEQGATTIWERLNSYTHENGFGGNNGMNSFNHYSFGAVGAWMIENSLGINRDEESVGFKHFVLKPEPDPTGQMTFAKGYYDSPFGRIESAWEIKGDEIHYRFVVPPNTTARLYLGKEIIELQAGTYNFSILSEL